MGDLILSNGRRPFLYLGSVFELATSLQMNRNIKYVLNCTRDIDVPDGVTSMRVPVSDDPMEDISSYFIPAIEFIEKARKNDDGCIFVHCYAGISRSTTIVTAYLVYRGMTLKTALSHILSLRPRICPNEGFFNQLKSASDSKMEYKEFLSLKKQ